MEIFKILNSSNLLHLLVYRPETCRDLSKWGYLHCLKVLSKKSLIQIFKTVEIKEKTNCDKKVLSLQTTNTREWVLAFYYIRAPAGMDHYPTTFSSPKLFEKQLKQLTIVFRSKVCSFCNPLEYSSTTTEKSFSGLKVLRKSLTMIS